MEVEREEIFLLVCPCVILCIAHFIDTQGQITLQLLHTYCPYHITCKAWMTVPQSEWTRPLLIETGV